ncbi:MAG: putative metal-binding motif-containing protein [Patescibacteria group bacterium]|nr:putative metal-binding motif-containing protein [Patescibacteria group bacterium]
MFKKITNFIKYHNSFIIIIAFVFVASFSALAASDDLRDEILGEEIVTKSGIDNSRILNVDLENFDLEMEIFKIEEDDENYYLDYKYETYGIQENIWEIVPKQKKMKVSKKFLEGKDLGLYAIQELSEVIDSEIAYLKKVQEKENEKGESKITQETKYEGLRGLVINTKTKELSVSYIPVVKPSQPEISNTPIVDISPGIMPEECNSSYLYLCDESGCEDAGGHWYGGEYGCMKMNKELCVNIMEYYWYDNVCHNVCQEKTFYLDADDDGFGDSSNATTSCEKIDGYIDNRDDCNDSEAEINPEAMEICGNDIDENCDGNDDVCEVVSEPKESEDICDSDHLDLCSNKNDCETIGSGFWYIKDEDEDEDEACYSACQEKTFYLDADDDGFGDSGNATSFCESPDDYADNDDDCDDSDAEINPDADEICDDGIDNNCDGVDGVCDNPNVPAKNFSTY